jgi:hypothetical protein
VTETKDREYWLSPMNRALLRRAFRKRQKQVKLRDGRKFKIKYEKQHIYSNGKAERVFVSPERGFAPCGWFRYSKITDELWITESQYDDSHQSLYVSYLRDFIESDLDGIDVLLRWKELDERTNQTVRNGFRNAKNFLGIHAEGVQVINVEGRVYLIKATDDDAE